MSSGGLRYSARVPLSGLPNTELDESEKRTMKYHVVTSCFLLTLALAAAPALGAITLSSSLEHAVFQRNPSDVALVPLSGTYTGTVTRIEARAVTIDGYYGTSTDWTTVVSSPSGGSYSSTMSVPAGWYTVEVRTMNGSTVVDTTSRSQVGVGEVFITAGQSNSAYYGVPQQTPADPRVSTYSGSVWQFGADSNPHVASGTAGSPWPDLGDFLVDYLQVPVGIIPVGQGSTEVADWLPGGSYYPRITTALATTSLNGVRAILWHQGESDTIAPATPQATYVSRLQTIIAQSRANAGYSVPWGVARASWLASTEGTGAQEAIVAAQNQVIAADPLVFGGPETNDFHLRGLTNGTGPHFNDAGLQEHGRLWKEAVVDYFDLPESTWEPPPMPVAAVNIQSGAKSVSNPFSLGWRFTPTKKMVITSLGLFDAAGDGVNNIVGGGQPVSLFEWGGSNPAAGTCLVATTVPTGTPADMAGSYPAHYVDIEPITLEIGKEYFIAAQCLGNDFLYTVTFGDDDNRPFDRAVCQGQATPNGSPAMPSLANLTTFPLGPSGSDDYFGGTFKYLVVVPGDADGDGRVNDTDAAILTENWGQTNANWLMGDFNEDGVIGPADAAILTANWGYGMGEAAQSTPQPSPVVLRCARPWTLLARPRRAASARDGAGTRGRARRP